MVGMVTRIAVVGAAGRMGRLATRLIEDDAELELHAAIGSGDSLDAVAGAGLVVDLTIPAVSPDVVDAALGHGVPVLVGTSGWTAERLTTLEAKLRTTPELGVVVVPNFSLGSVVATWLSTIAAPYFDSIEILESHHAGKVDSPSGTAIRTAELIGDARAALGPVSAPHVDQRARGQQVASIPVHSLRMDGVLAEQEVRFGGTGESVRIVHQTVSDASYESGLLLGMREAPHRRGLMVGLDRLLGLGAPGAGDAGAGDAATA